MEHLAETVQRLHDLIEPVLEESGLELIDLQFSRKGGKRGGYRLKLIIDRAGRTSYAPQRSADGTLTEAGVTIDDCVKASKTLGPLLDVEDVIAGAYDFEVSSPGVNRLLKRPEHFALALNQTIRVKTRVPVGDSDSTFYIETLASADDEGITLALKRGELTIPYRLIAKATLEYEF